MAVVHHLPTQWFPLATAPFDRDLEIAVIDRRNEVHALAFPSRKDDGGWIDAATKKRIDVQPTHWRLWREEG